MAAPVVTARASRAPAGARMENGHQILVVLSGDPNLSIWERSVTPPGYDMGDMIDTSTQHNVSLRQQAFRALAMVTEGAMEVGYNPEYIDQIRAQLGINQALTVHFPNLASISFFGGIRTFEPTGMTDGEFPTATCALAVTNTDPASGSEEFPVYTAPPPPPP